MFRPEVGWIDCEATVAVSMVLPIVTPRPGFFILSNCLSTTAGNGWVDMTGARAPERKDETIALLESLAR